MDAYVLALSYDTYSDTRSLSKAKVRILDNSVNAKVRVFDYPIEAVTRVVYSGDLKIEGLTCSNNRISSLKYFGEPIKKVVPNLVDNKGHYKRTPVVLTKVYRDQDRLMCNLCDCFGVFHVEPVQRSTELNYLITNRHSKNYIEYSRSFIKSRNFLPIKPSESKNTDEKGSLSDSVPCDDNQLIKTDLASSRLFNSWLDMGEYISLCDKYNVKYRYDGGMFFGASRELDVLNIPRGIVQVARCCVESDVDTNENKDCNCHTVMIPKTVQCLQYRCFIDAPNLSRLVFEPRDLGDEYNANSLDLDGITSLLVNNQINNNLCDVIPLNLRIIQNLCRVRTSRFNPNLEYKSVEAQGDISRLTNVSRMSNCFVKTVFLSPLVLPKTLANIEGCFCECDGIDSLVIRSEMLRIKSSFSSYQNRTGAFIKTLSIEDGNHLREIVDSFDQIDAEVIDFSRCSELAFIETSFNGCKNLRKVILPKDSNLSIRDSFKDCPLLSEVIVSEGYSSIYASSFKNSALTELHINSHTKLERVLLPDCVLKVHGTYVQHKAFRYCSFKRIELDESITELKDNSFFEADIDNVVFTNIKKVGYYCFHNARGEILDLFNWDLTYLPPECFSSCSIKTLILPKNLMGIEAKCLIGANIKNLFVPSSIAYVNQGVFKDFAINISGAPNIYTTKDNLVLKNIKRKNFIVYEFDTDEEAYDNLINSLGISSKREQLKAKVVMGNSANPVVAAIAGDKYIKNSAYLYSIYSKLTKGIDIEAYRPKLNTSKYAVTMTLDDILMSLDAYKSVIDSDIDIRTDFLKEKNSDSVGLSALPYAFIWASNILTLATNPSKYVYNIGNLVKILEKQVELNKSYVKIRLSKLFTCEYCSIFSLNIKFRSTLWNNKSLLIIFISIGGKVVYCTSLIMDKQDIGSRCVIEELITPIYDNGEKLLDLSSCNSLLRDILPLGFYYSNSSYLNTGMNGIPIPKQLCEMIDDEVGKSLMHIASESIGREVTQRYLISILDGTVFLVKSKGNNGLRYGSWDNLFKGFSVSGIYESIYEVPALKRQWQYIYGKDASTLIEQTIDPQFYRQNVISKDGAYDKLEECYEWQLSYALRKNKIDDISKLNSKIAELILKSCFFHKKSIDIEEKSINYYIKRKRVDLIDGAMLLQMPYESSRVSNIAIPGCTIRCRTMLIKPNDPLGGKMTVYFSSESFKDIFNKIYCIFDDEAMSIGYIDPNEEYSLDDFTFMGIDPCEYYEHTIGWGISKKTGNVYILAFDRNHVTRALFRLKDASAGCFFELDARVISEFRSSRKPKILNSSIPGNLAKIAFRLKNAGFTRLKSLGDDNDTQTLYLRMVNGLTNFETSSSTTSRFENLIAKQPKL